MSPAALIILQLVAQYGPVIAKRIHDAVNQGMGPDGKPTEAMWDNLIAIENESASKFKAALNG